METSVKELKNIIEKYTPLLRELSEDVWHAKPLAHKWSKAEELGHTIDSAQNNLRRFIVGQHEEQPYIVYKQDDWVKQSNYQNYPLADLIDLWVLINKHICVVVGNIPADKESRLVLTQDVHTIEWLASDYNKHLLHHLHHVLDLVPVDYP
jgi:hypothetical protein